MQPRDWTKAMALVMKQCQGQCQRVKMIPDGHTHCSRCWHRLMRQQHRDARQRAWDAGYDQGYSDAASGKARS